MSHLKVNTGLAVICNFNPPKCKCYRNFAVIVDFNVLAFIKLLKENISECLFLKQFTIKLSISDEIKYGFLLSIFQNFTFDCYSFVNFVKICSSPICCAAISSGYLWLSARL